MHNERPVPCWPVFVATAITAFVAGMIVRLAVDTIRL